MTSISSTRPTQPTRAPAREPQAKPAAAPDDLKALKEAFSKAREKVDRFTARQGKEAARGKETLADRTPAAPTQQPRARADDRETARRQISADRASDGQGTSAPLQATPQAIPMPTMPAAHVDPSGFAQMLADLWTRENGKGAKEVRVRFGESAWPATGALLVRNPAGALDIALSTGGPSLPGDERLETLGRHLRDAGLEVGRLAISHDGEPADFA